MALASAVKAEAKPTLSTKGTFFSNNTANDTVIKINPALIKEMKVGDKKDISVNIEPKPEHEKTPQITPTYDEEVVEVETTSSGFKITALKESNNNLVKITFSAEGLADQALTIEKIVKQNNPSPTAEENYVVWINEAPDNPKKWKQSQHTIQKMTIGGTGVDLKILNNNMPIIADVSVFPPENVQIESQNGYLYHLRAEQIGKNIKVFIKINGLTIDTITISQVAEKTAKKGQSQNAKITSNQQKTEKTDNNNQQLLQKQIEQLNITNQEKSDSITKLLNNISLLNTENTKKSNRIRDLESEKPLISTALAIIIGIVGTLIVAVILFIILYKKIEKTFSEDLKDAEKESHELRKQLNDNNSDKSFKEKRLKELEDEVNQFKKENDSLKMEIMHLQKNTSKVQSTINQETVEDQSVSENTPETPEPRIVSLYSDCIVDGYFNRVSERPDEDTVFELVLDEENKSEASVDVYQGAHRRIIANPAFIDGCEKQIVGNSSVHIDNKGIAEKDADNGKWRLIKAPIIEIR